MEYVTEIINISKIEDGFFLGDKFCATNIDVIMQFKISHIINAAACHIINQFETLGIKYFSINWKEIPSQKLLDIKDEIQNKIVSFIDEALTKGEGLLVHSVKGVNRALVVVVIYFMKKFWWSVKKCLEFLKIKVKNGKISTYFLKQLEAYETRIKRKMSKEWYNLNSIKTKEELIIRNTYLNSLKNSKTNKFKMYKDENLFNKNKYNPNPHVSFKFNENNDNNKIDLILQKNIKDVYSHINLKPKKKCIKIKNALSEDSDSDNININNYINDNLKKYMSNNIIKNNNNSDKDNTKNLINLGLNMKIVDKINQINNNFNNLNIPKQRPNSAEKNKNNKDNNNIDKNIYDNIDKLSNYFEKLEKKEKEAQISLYKFDYNNNKDKIKNYKKMFLKNQNNKIKNNVNNNINNSRQKRPSSYDKNNINNNKNGKIKINKQYIYPDKIINNSININMINYFSNGNDISQQIPNNIMNRINNNENDSFLINNNYESFNFFDKEMPINQQDLNRIKNNKMNNSANNFYNFNKNGINSYYNVMGQSLNLNSNKYNNFNEKRNMFVNNSTKNFKKININNSNNISFIIKNNDINSIKVNAKNNKRAVTPKILLSRKNNYPNNNIYNRININHMDFANIKLDESNNNDDSINLNQNNKSFIINPKYQCKFLFIIKYIFYFYSFAIY